MNRIKRYIEPAANIGMLAIAVSILLPLLNMTTVSGLVAYRWIYAGGALLYWAARILGVSFPDSSQPLRVRRLHRIEFWAGAAFATGAFFWFWNMGHASPFAGPLALLRDTIMFSLAGALLQAIAAWMIYWQLKKQGNE